MSEVTDAGVRQLAQLRSLEDLELQFGWQFGDEGVAALARLGALSRLDLMYRWVGRYRDPGACEGRAEAATLVSAQVYPTGCYCTAARV